MLATSVSKISTKEVNKLARFLQSSIPIRLKEFEDRFNRILTETHNVKLSQYFFNLQKIKVIEKKHQKLVYQFAISNLNVEEAEDKIVQKESEKCCKNFDSELEYNNDDIRTIPLEYQIGGNILYFNAKICSTQQTDKISILDLFFKTHKIVCKSIISVKNHSQ